MSHMLRFRALALKSIRQIVDSSKSAVPGRSSMQDHFDETLR